MLLLPVWHWRQREGCPREIEWPVDPRWISVCCRSPIGRMRGGRRPPPSPANMLNCAGYVDQFRRPGTAGSQIPEACCVPCPPRDREGATTVCISCRSGKCPWHVAISLIADLPSPRNRYIGLTCSSAHTPWAKEVPSSTSDHAPFRFGNPHLDATCTSWRLATIFRFCGCYRRTPV